MAEDENGTPQMSLEDQVVNYIAYLQGKMTGSSGRSDFDFRDFNMARKVHPDRLTQRLGISTGL